jgi:hypothetical protein
MPRKFTASERRCTKCKNEYPATTEYFHVKYIRKDGTPGLQSRCKKCCAEYRAEHHRNNRERDNEINRRWREAHSEQMSALNTAWYHRNREHRRAVSREWYRTSPKARIKKLRYRTRKAELPNAFTGQDWQRALDYWHHVCAICGAQQGFWNPMSADHWIPLTWPECPGTVPTNMLPMCKCCNDGKAAHDPVQWLERKLGKRRAQYKLAEIEAYFDWLSQFE